MTECLICGRAMDTETHLPLDVYRRANCEPERDLLDWRFAPELAKECRTFEVCPRASTGRPPSTVPLPPKVPPTTSPTSHSSGRSATSRPRSTVSASTTTTTPASERREAPGESAATPPFVSANRERTTVSTSLRPAVNRLVTENVVLTYLSVGHSHRYHPVLSPRVQHRGMGHRKVATHPRGCVVLYRTRRLTRR